MMKKNLATILIAILAASMLLFVGCNTGKREIKLSEIFPETAMFECGEDSEFPTAYVVDGNGSKTGDDIRYKFISPTGKESETAYPIIRCVEVGEWRLEIVGAKKSLKYVFTVSDTKEPLIKLDKIPTSLFIGENETGDLPTAQIEDASEVTVTKTLQFTNASGTTVDWDYNAMNDRYRIGESGIFNYTVTATDVYKNSNTESAKWRVKDAAWQDPNLAENYLADYNEEGYYNYTREGDVNPYWNIKDFKEEHLETYKGADGVMKLSVTFTGSSLTSMKLKLAKPLTIAELGNKYLAIRVWTDGIGISNQFIFAGAQKIVEGETSSATIRKPLTKGEWATYYLTASDLRDKAFFSVAGDDTSPITDLQIAFQRIETIKYLNLYIDSITIAEQLPEIEDLACVDKEITWKAIANAVGYRVKENEKVTIVEGSKYTAENAKTYVEITAVADGKLFINSAKICKVFGLEAREKYVSSFDDPLYINLISDNVNVGAETDGYRPTSLETTYDAEKHQVKAVVGAGSWGIVNAVGVIFPKIEDFAAGSKIIIRMNVTAEGVKNVMVTDILYTANFGNYELKSGMNSYVIDVTTAISMSGLQLVFKNISTPVEIVFEAISKGAALEAPTLTNVDGKITWTAVEGALGYLVKVGDGVEEEFTSDVKSYKYPTEGYGVISVRAIGDNINSLNSESSTIKYDNRNLLPSPTLSVTDGKIVWSAVPNATGYSVQVGTATAETTTDCFYNYTGTDIAKISVCAIGNETDVSTSEPSEINVGKVENKLVKIVSDIAIKRISYQEPTYIQYEFTSPVFQAGAINASSFELLVNGKPCTDLAIAYGDEKKLNFSGTFPKTDNTKILIKAGSLIAQGDNAYRLSSDFMCLYFKAGWRNASEPTLVKVDWTLPDGTLAQIKFAENVWDSDVPIDATGLNIEANGAKVEFTSVTAPSTQHIRIYGKFPITVTAENPVPTFVLKAGSVALQPASNKAIIFTKDYTFTYAKNWGWVMAVESDIKETYPENAQSVQFGFTGSELFANSPFASAKRMKIKFNGEYIDATKLSVELHRETCNHFYLRGTEALQFPTTTGATITIEKGSIVLQEGGSFIITNTLTLEFNGTGWITK